LRLHLAISTSLNGVGKLLLRSSNKRLHTLVQFNQVLATSSYSRALWPRHLQMFQDRNVHALVAPSRGLNLTSQAYQALGRATVIRGCVIHRLNLMQTHSPLSKPFWTTLCLYQSRVSTKIARSVPFVGNPMARQPTLVLITQSSPSVSSAGIRSATSACLPPSRFLALRPLLSNLLPSVKDLKATSWVSDYTLICGSQGHYSARAPDDHQRQMITPTTTTTQLQRVITQLIWI
jgi:hypothetical protein